MMRLCWFNIFGYFWAVDTFRLLSWCFSLAPHCQIAHFLFDIVQSCSVQSFVSGFVLQHSQIARAPFRVILLASGDVQVWPRRKLESWDELLNQNEYHQSWYKLALITISNYNRQQQLHKYWFGSWWCSHLASIFVGMHVEFGTHRPGLLLMCSFWLSLTFWTLDLIINLKPGRTQRQGGKGTPRSLSTRVTQGTAVHCWLRL